MGRSSREVGDHEVTCLSCGWMSYAVTRAEAQVEVDRMNRYLASLSEQDRRGWRPEGASVATYVCMNCGGQEFRPALPEDCPDSVTVNPVIWEGL